MMLQSRNNLFTFLLVLLSGFIIFKIAITIYNSFNKQNIIDVVPNPSDGVISTYQTENIEPFYIGAQVDQCTARPEDLDESVDTGAKINTVHPTTNPATISIASRDTVGADNSAANNALNGQKICHWVLKDEYKILNDAEEVDMQYQCIQRGPDGCSINLEEFEMFDCSVAHDTDTTLNPDTCNKNYIWAGDAWIDMPVLKNAFCSSSINCYDQSNAGEEVWCSAEDTQITNAVAALDLDAAAGNPAIAKTASATYLADNADAATHITDVEARLDSIFQKYNDKLTEIGEHGMMLSREQCNNFGKLNLIDLKTEWPTAPVNILESYKDAINTSLNGFQFTVNNDPTRFPRWNVDNQNSWDSYGDQGNDSKEQDRRYNCRKTRGFSILDNANEELENINKYVSDCVAMTEPSKCMVGGAPDLELQNVHACTAGGYCFTGDPGSRVEIPGVYDLAHCQELGGVFLKDAAGATATPGEWIQGTINDNIQPATCKVDISKSTESTRQTINSLGDIVYIKEPPKFQQNICINTDPDNTTCEPIPASCGFECSNIYKDREKSIYEMITSAQPDNYTDDQYNGAIKLLNRRYLDNDNNQRLRTLEFGCRMRMTDDATTQADIQAYKDGNKIIGDIQSKITWANSGYKDHIGRTHNRWNVAQDVPGEEGVYIDTLGNEAAWSVGAFTDGAGGLEDNCKGKDSQVQSAIEGGLTDELGPNDLAILALDTTTSHNDARACSDSTYCKWNKDKTVGLLGGTRCELDQKALCENIDISADIQTITHPGGDADVPMDLSTINGVRRHGTSDIYSSGCKYTPATDTTPSICSSYTADNIRMKESCRDKKRNLESGTSWTGIPSLCPYSHKIANGDYENGGIIMTIDNNVDETGPIPVWANFTNSNRMEYDLLRQYSHNTDGMYTRPSAEQSAALGLLNMPNDERGRDKCLFNMFNTDSFQQMEGGDDGRAGCQSGNYLQASYINGGNNANQGRRGSCVAKTKKDAGGTESAIETREEYYNLTKTCEAAFWTAWDLSGDLSLPAQRAACVDSTNATCTFIESKPLNYKVVEQGICYNDSSEKIDNVTDYTECMAAGGTWQNGLEYVTKYMIDNISSINRLYDEPLTSSNTGLSNLTTEQQGDYKIQRELGGLVVQNANADLQPGLDQWVTATAAGLGAGSSGDFTTPPPPPPPPPDQGTR